MANVVVNLDTRELERIEREAPGILNDVLIGLAYDIESGAKQRAPVDTGAMKNSIYTATKKGSGFGMASSSAKSQNKDVETSEHPSPSGDVVAVVGPCVNYAEYVEYGTSKRRAQPFLTPAVERVSKKLEDGTTYKELFGEGAL